jgi:GxxExxY protein
VAPRVLPVPALWAGTFFNHGFHGLGHGFHGFILEGDMVGLLEEKLTYKIRGVLFKVHSTLGPGFREETYKRASVLELRKQGLYVEVEKEFEIKYDDQVVDRFRLDILVERKIILELKAVDRIVKVHESQLLSYLKATGMRIGFLANFGESSLQIVRRIT